MKMQCLVLALCSLLLASCKIVDKGGIELDDDETYLYEVNLKYRVNPRRGYVYVVNGVAVGESTASLRDYLARQKKGSVIFQSSQKLLWETIDMYKNLFTELGFQVDQFWIPSCSSYDPHSPYPGCIRLATEEDKTKREQGK